MGAMGGSSNVDALVVGHVVTAGRTWGPNADTPSGTRQPLPALPAAAAG
ncbi:hypothetical protein I551_8371 [Mycobacterium ulcerans str. Harvey]|uniref:Uncharacterized protein n=1 Tax=Mycobacterium ulcerans str. Harvey TaxID=1299332 RepID=A0ABN0QKI6_MYCUL|nr:hypothetical protein I551_8371 [Mycobacterium ulcerans str. Harvey]